MIRRLIAVSLLLTLLATIVAPSGTAASFNQRRQRRAGMGESSSPRSLLIGLRSYAALGNWLLDKLADRSERERPMTTAPPVTAFLNPAPVFLDAPTSLTVTAASSTSVNLGWTASSGFVDHYQVERGNTISGPFLFLSNAASPGFNDTTVSSGHGYLYRVRAIGSGGIFSGPSNMALGTAVTFEFSALTNQLIKAQHVYDVRTAVNAVRAAANLPAATWTRGTLAGLTVVANDVQELRNKLDEALAVLSISVTAYQDPTLTAGSTLIKAIHVEQLQARSTKGSSNNSGPLDSDSSTARLDPLNETGGGGENPLSRNFNWNLSLVGLPGRGGLDLGLTLSYNSLVWSKVGSSSIWFDADNGFPGPGFRLGFPVIQPLYYNSEVGKYAFLLIGSDGSRTELRQVDASALYEAGDSSHLLLDSTTMILRGSDGTQLTYVLQGGEYNCTQIKDRNGNYLTVSYNQAGRINTITDTLARIITFNYDANGWLTSITQIWNQGSGSQVTHNWATFTYANTTIQTNFSGLTVYGPANSSTIKTLAQVTLADGFHSDFSYTSWGQIWKVSNFAADNHLLSYRSYNLPLTTGTAHSDCPRFTERRDWAQYWNGDTEGTPASNEEAVTTFAVPVSDTWIMPEGTESVDGTRAQVTAPDGTSSKIYFIGTAGSTSGWRRGLPALVNTYDSSAVLQRQAMTTWTQDNPAVSYVLNPRVMETNVYDPAGNRARTEVTYQQFTFANGTNCQLPRDIYEYAANASTKLRSTRTDYKTSTSYSDRRILGVVSERQVYEGDVNNGGVLMSKVGFFYDNENGATSLQGSDAPVQHDNTNYSASFVTGRGNLSSVKRYDVTNTSLFTTTSSKFNTAGGVVSSKDALNHEVAIAYADAFSDGNNLRNTLAYPTTVTDPDGYSSTSKYHFDFGAVTYKRTPQPNVTTNTPGPEQSFTFDTIGRLQQTTNLVNNAYARVEYPTSQIRVDSYTTIEAGLGEAHSFRITDGAGRVVATAWDHPGSVGGFSGQRTVYDTMGRTIRTSNPTETSASGAPSQWATAGDDAAAGWIYIEQTYDWKGRPLVTTNQDGTTKTASYAGCGCAGGEVVTLTDEGTLESGNAKKRQQKIYSDVLGREWKTEILNWDGTGPFGTGPNNTVYSATVNTYDVRDQVTQVRQYAGAEGSTTFQETTITFDGFGRLKTRHAPEQDTNKVTTWSYNPDDSIQTVTDARGASANFGYNNRKMVTSVSWSVPAPSPSPIPTPAPVTLTYDAAGNRTSMTDGFGSLSYEYNQLSQMTSETRTFTGITNPSSADGKFKLSYDYTLAGQLKKFTDATNMTILYGYDAISRLNGVTGSDTLVGGVATYASGFQYRAAGTLKQVSFGSHTTTIGYNARLQPSTFEVSGNVVHQDYDYYADGRISFVHNTTDNRFDRSYKYDHATRLTLLATGGQARQDSGVSPLSEFFTYNQFDDVLTRLNESWQNAYWDFGNYTNHRRADWNYDSDGRVSGIDTRSYVYDALGQPRSLVGERWLINHYVPLSIDSGFDGDGNRITETSTASLSVSTTYYLRSTVLGAIVEDLNSSGQKLEGYVFSPSGSLLASQVPGLNYVMHKQLSPIGVSQYEFFASDTSSGLDIHRELDAAGAMIPLQSHSYGHGDTFGDLPDGGGGPSDSRFASIAAPAAGCVLDGIWVPCSMAYRVLESGAARVCPDNDCSPRRVDIDIRYRGGGSQRISGLVADPFYDVNFTFRGAPAQSAAEAFLKNGSAGLASRIDSARDAGLKALIDALRHHPSPQNPLPGSFEVCVGNLGATGFTKEAADLINQISDYEGTSRDLLAVTWMNESNFAFHPPPNTNGHPENVDRWDVGPFQINVHWTLAQVAAKEVSFAGLNERNVFGYDFYRSDGKTPLAFTGDPLSNGRMGARRLNAIGGNDQNKAVKYTAPGAQPARKISYQRYAGRFRDFFNCYHP